MIKIGAVAKKEAVKEARKAIMDILECETAEQTTKVVALETLRALSAPGPVSHVSITNNTLSAVEKSTQH